MKVSIYHSFLSSLVTQYKTFTFKQSTIAVRGRKRKELKRRRKKKDEEEEEEEGKRQVTNGDRESKRESHCVRQNVSASVWGTWWCSTSTKFLIFQSFYCCVQVSPRCVGMKIRICFPFICRGNC